MSEENVDVARQLIHAFKRRIAPAGRARCSPRHPFRRLPSRDSRGQSPTPAMLPGVLLWSIALDSLWTKSNCLNAPRRSSRIE
jgi:hypothetical protein